MAVLRTPDATHAYGPSSRPLDRARSRAPIGAHTRTLARRGVALLVYSTGYPLLAIALWTGARNGDWAIASAFVVLGVITSFLGWGLLHAVCGERTGGTASQQDVFPAAVTVFLAVYNRIGAIVVLLGSYAVNATLQGWPAPETFLGWFALVWLPLFIAVAFPVTCASPQSDPGA